MPALPKHTQGKLVDTWYYAYKGIPDPDDSDDEAEVRKGIVQDQRIEVKVFLKKESDALDAPPHGTKAVEFFVTCEAPRIRLQGTDIEIMRKVAWGLCDTHYEVKWSKYYLVRIGAGFIYAGTGAGLDFIYADVHKGIAHDGTELLREEDHNGRRYGHKISPWPGRFEDKNGKAMACIPCTPQNTEALEEFARRVTALRKRIVDLVRPENIEQTLLHLGSNALLPPADPPELSS